VTDLVGAHLLALDALRSGAGCGKYNCGYGHGFSVREIIAEMEKVTHRPLPVKEAARRPGDPAVLIADSAKLKTALNWRPEHEDIQTIVRSALDWERRFNERQSR
jgi:UDP-glucose 4-epimerase